MNLCYLEAPVKNSMILMEQSFNAHMPLQMICI